MKFIPFIMNEVNQIINFSAGNRSIMHMMPSSDLRNSTPQKEKYLKMLLVSMP